MPPCTQHLDGDTHRDCWIAEGRVRHEAALEHGCDRRDGDALHGRVLGPAVEAALVEKLSGSAQCPGVSLAVEDVDSKVERAGGKDPVVALQESGTQPGKATRRARASPI